MNIAEAVDADPIIKSLLEGSLDHVAEDVARIADAYGPPKSDYDSVAVGDFRRLLATRLCRGAKCELSTTSHIDDIAAALGELADRDDVRAAVAALPLDADRWRDGADAVIAVWTARAEDEARLAGV